MIGQKFNRWTIIATAGKNPNGRSLYLCRCDCGTEKVQIGSAVKIGITKSCGCFNREQSSKKHKTHGLTLTPIYGVWKNMLKRCYKLNSTDYYLYGARGIKVCDPWLKFQNFYNDMGNIPFPLAQIDRKDCDGDYTPANCQWSTATENMRNRRTNRYLTYKNETHCFTEWEEIKKFPRNMISSRLAAGWELDKIMETPPKKTGIAARSNFKYCPTQHQWAVTNPPSQESL